MRAVLVAALMLAFASGAPAQENAPFDMSPERPTPSAPADDPAVRPDEEAAPPPAQPEAPAEPARFRRFLLPDAKLTLAGEQARSTWAIYLSPRQAASPATLTFGYQNAVVVAPESSKLSLVVNGTAIHEEQVSAPDGVVSREVAIPAGVLRAGRNEIGFSARHRHRTDCTIESTYELWTEIAASGTYLSFEDPAAAELATAEELSAVGGDAAGKVRVAIVAPALARLDIANDLMRLSQALARHINTPDIEISVSSRPPGQSAADLVVLLGTAEELSSFGYALPAIEGAFSAFAPPSEGQAPVYLVSGRDRAQWSAALDSLAAPVDRSLDVQRDVFVTEAWRTPNAPMIFAGKQVPFADMGLRSEQFSGRRYTAEFEFGVPADFYAEAYGEARILLDAAYSDQVEPGSLINVYVNGSVAASMPITATQGAVLNRFPINFTMQHIQPGLNRIVLEADLRTAADEVCSPGTAANDTPRFALFDTSRFDMPTFARIAQRPNLSALSGTSFPYGRSADPIAVMVDRTTDDGLSGLATLLARMARSAGRILPIEFVASQDGLGMRNAIIMGGAADIPQQILQQVGVSVESDADWEAGASGSPAPAGPTLDEWRKQVTGSWFGSTWRDFREWLQRTFNITSDMLRFAPEEEGAYVPPPTSGLVVAQSSNPAGSGTWTVIVAPDAAALRANLVAFTDLRNWDELSGHITSFNPATREVDTVPVGQFEFVETVPPSIWNYRLIAANWLSANILSYSLALILACVVLGATTTFLLSRLGRRR
ncbi:cellulose biosynthesis cyclic di-GMP-binding regulatory protein BcsB [Mesorhizobium sp. J428]|uniref:cellulose biosynthesis cyclic di-GMP-binding regulatory protein BcsB n=1 Tax=Mesorhizobium sp. J428 TaxID=2898440 RepID=UPI002150E4DA|nr:cellulose biosynthesis cyclic di-GMP-binding regulatory protein BcsB [Mesorhizobium sp. J428]MCR5856017.1 cellulose biosynthesis cyclic di-GMP-binding regulatory protein BcsB [Mesorhizobium sp. J428]